MCLLLLASLIFIPHRSAEQKEHFIHRLNRLGCVTFRAELNDDVSEPNPLTATQRENGNKKQCTEKGGLRLSWRMSF